MARSPARGLGETSTLCSPGSDRPRRTREADIAAPSIRRNFGWNLIGNAAYTFSLWVLLAILARLTNQAVVGQFSLILAISAPVFLFVGCNLRTLIATDARHRWRMGEHLVLRQLLNGLAFVLAVLVGFVSGMRGGTLAALVVVCFAKCVEATSQTYYGYLQQHERLDLVARSLVVRSVTGPVFFTTGIVLGDDLVYGCIGLLVAWVLPQLLVDRRSARTVAAISGGSLGHGERVDWPSVRDMARKGAPLGIDAGISSLSINVPRYAVHNQLGPESLGVFASLAYLAQTVQMISSSLAGAMIARLAVYHHEGRRQAFVRLLGRLTIFGLGVMVVAVIATALVGETVIRFALGPEYADTTLLMLLMISAGVMTLQRSLCKSLEASLRFKTYVLVDGVTTLTIALLSPICVNAWGLNGAAIAMMGGFALGTLVVAVVLFDIVAKMPQIPPPGHVTEVAAPDSGPPRDHPTGG